METQTIQQDELMLAVVEAGVEQTTQQMLVERFRPFMEQVQEWRDKCFALVVQSEQEVEKMQQAREGRLALKAVRVEADKTRKLLKEDSLRYGKAVQAVYNVIEAAVAPMEEHLLMQEKYAEVQAKLRMEQLNRERLQLIDSECLLAYIPVNLPLGEILQEDFDKLVSGARLQKKAAEDEWARAEAETRRKADLLNLHLARKDEALRVWNFLPAEVQSAHLGEMDADAWAAALATAEKAHMDAQLENKRLREQLEEQNRVAEQRNALARERANELQPFASFGEPVDFTTLWQLTEDEFKGILQRKKAAFDEQRKQNIAAAAEQEAMAKTDKAKMQQMLADLEHLKTKYTFKSKKYATLHIALQDLIGKTISYANQKI